MAEFQEVMSERARMCNTLSKDYNDCSDCPLHKVRLKEGYNTCYLYFTERYKDSEKLIMKWAAEHPKPLYESWFEYLVRIGVLSKEAQRVITSYTKRTYHDLSAPIPADIVQKLGLQPKER